MLALWETDCDMSEHGTSSLARLLRAQRERFEHDGFLVVPGVLRPPELDTVIAAVGELREPSLRSGRSADSVFSALNVVEKSDALLDLVDHPALLGLVCDLLGPNIVLVMSQALVRPPTPSAGLQWHHDGPKPYPFPSVSGLTPLLHLKVAWFLNDVSAPNSGNLIVLPGSHRTAFPVGGAEADAITSLDPQGHALHEPIESAVPGATQVLAEPGDALVFHNALWHAVAPNTSVAPRQALYYTYGPTWVRLADRAASSPELLERAGPVRRQLLGGSVGSDGGYGTAYGDGSLDEQFPLIRIIEGKSYAEVLAEQVTRELRLQRQAP